VVPSWWLTSGPITVANDIIILRTVQVTLMLYLIGLWLRLLFNAAWPWQFDSAALWHNLADTIPWFGAIFGAVYVALYAPFASQWSYLAGVYNQIRQTFVTQKDWYSGNAIHMELWNAGFIEDALDLHLATKPAFAPFLLRLLDDEGVREKFKQFAFDGEDRLDKLKTELIHKGFAQEEDSSEDDG
jgi:hypothetical protein